MEAIPRYLEISMRLLAEEGSLFSGQVRLGFDEFRKVRDQNGNIVDAGSVSFSTPTAAELNDALATAQRFRAEIQQRRERFPDVVLDLASGLSGYTVNLENNVYYLPVSAPAAEGQAFFHYLDQLEAAAGKFTLAELSVSTYRTNDMRVDFPKGQQVLLIVDQLVDSVNARASIKSVEIYPRSLAGGSIDDDKVNVSFGGGRLMISNLVDFFGTVASPEAVRRCLATQDIRFGFSVRCSPR